MRAIERDRLLARLGWAYLVLLVIVSAYYLWPRTLPPGSNAGSLDLSKLPVTSKIDFDERQTIGVSAKAATRDAEREIRAVIDRVDGDGATLKVPVRDRDHLLDALAAFRAVSKTHPQTTIVLHFESSNAVVRIERGAFDDPGGRIGHELLERKLAKKSTTATAATEGATP